MAGTHQRQNPAHPRPTAWVGVIAFNSIILMMIGALEVVEGLVALFREDYYAVTSDGLVVSLNFAAWGWAHLVVGVAAIAAGIGTLRGQMWARVTGIVIASISALVNMLFLAADPVWATIVITLCVLAIYALAVHGREMKP
jgi:hypothetical protein